MDKDPFKEYKIQSESNKRYKSYAWHTAIGLQAVDGLKTSRYLIDTAVKNIEGNISIDEAKELLDKYYEENPKFGEERRTEEADKVSVRIAQILSEESFSFAPNEYISIHKKLFKGIYSYAGKIRDYNITKKEWVLDGATVIYGSASELKSTLDYDFSEERRFSYKNLTMDEIISHLAFFISRLWQIHIFGEGNTRTTAVFFIKYLRTLGFDVTNDIFAENAWYFRNALVRANYNDLKNGIHETTEYLELFLRNLLLDEGHELHNRDMHISGVFKEELNADNDNKNIRSNIEKSKVDIETAKVDIETAKVDIETAKVDIEAAKVDIEAAKVDIEAAKVDIRNKLLIYSDKITEKTVNYVIEIFRKYGKADYFGRSDVEVITGLKSSGASKLIKLMLESNVIIPVKGHGKGKYIFF